MSDGQGELLLEVRPGKTCCPKPTGSCSLVWLIVCLLGIALGVGIAILIIQSADTPPMVITTCGNVEGYYDVRPDVHVYQGIPYAVAPKENLRWRRPVAMSNTTGTCWKGILRAVGAHAACARLTKDGHVTGSEDCLLLDVYTPAGPYDVHQPLTPRPVVVWMDAGPELNAASVSPGVSVTTRTGAIYVNVQYRLGAMGFLVAEELGKNQTGNYGLWDQIEALRWVRDNIKGFGGDPDQVTLVSQSSGSTSGLPLVTSPHARGLFQRAWLLSTSPVLNHTLEEAKVMGSKIANHTKCKTAECLRKMSSHDILIAASVEWNSSFILDLPKKDQFQAPMAVIDGDLLPDTPSEVWQAKSGNYPDVPLLIGSEAQMSPSKRKQLEKPATTQALQKYIGQFLDTFSKNLTRDILDLYAFPPGVTQEYKLATIVSDIRVGCGLNALSHTAAKALNSSVYRYVVTSQPSSRSTLDGVHFATHGWDSYSFFGAEGAFLDQHAQESDLEFTRLIHKIGKNFIRSGRPGFTKWPKFPSATAEIDEAMGTVVKDYHQSQCEYLAQAGLLPYGWMN